MGLIVMRHVNDHDLEYFMNENRHLNLNEIDLGVHVLTSGEGYDFDQEFDYTARAINQEVGKNGLNLFYHSGIPRAEITAKALAKKLGYTGEFISNSKIYERFPGELLDHVDEKLDSIVVTHQPAIESLLGIVAKHAQSFRIERNGHIFSARYIDPNKLPEVKG